MATAFISEVDLSDITGRDVSADDGATIAVNAACDICRTVAEQTFTAGTSTIYLDGTGTDALLLPEVPVTSVTSVRVSDGFHPPTWNTAGTVDYALSDNGTLFATDTAGTATMGTTWPRGRQNVQVTYVHGYADAVFPADVRAVALAIAQRYLVQGPAKSESLGNVNVSYAVNPTDLTEGEQRILRKYRRAK